MKRCSKCKERKSFFGFYKNKTRKDGFHPQCKKCMNSCIQKYHQTHKAERIENARKYRQLHKTERAAYERKRRKTIIGCLQYRFSIIKQRCNNTKNPGYKDYGGRGIRCKFKSSQEFVDYVINILKVDPHGLQIDRIDNNGHYEPGNIQLVTCAVNNKNKRRTR